MQAVIIILSALFAVSTCDGPIPPGKYVWDFLKPALTAAEVMTVVATRGEDYPKYNTIPSTGFQCSTMKQPGFYADVETKCQVFHRCEQSGNMTSYLCVNSTVFNQITLICDAWFNVECERSGEFVDFANSRLYTNLPLFDTPPAGYVAPSSSGTLQSSAVISILPVKSPKPLIVVTSQKASAVKVSSKVSAVVVSQKSTGVKVIPAVTTKPSTSQQSTPASALPLSQKPIVSVILSTNSTTTTESTTAAPVTTSKGALIPSTAAPPAILVAVSQNPANASTNASTANLTTPASITSPAPTINATTLTAVALNPAAAISVAVPTAGNTTTTPPSTTVVGVATTKEVTALPTLAVSTGVASTAPAAASLKPA